MRTNKKSEDEGGSTSSRLHLRMPSGLLAVFSIFSIDSKLASPRPLHRFCRFDDARARRRSVAVQSKTESTCQLP